MAKNTKTLIAVMSDKGGVGKSTWTEMLWDRLLKSGLDIRAFDLDGTTGSFTARCGEFDEDGQILKTQSANGVTPLFLHGSPDDRDRIASVLETGAELVLVDFPATSLTVLSQIEQDWSFREEIANAGYNFTVVTVCTPFPASLSNVTRSLDLYPAANHVVVFNLAFGQQDHYFLWDGDPIEGIEPAIAKKRIEEMGARAGVIWFPALDKRAAILTEKYMLGFREAGTDRRMTMANRSRLRNWVDDFAESIHPVEHLLGLSKQAPVESAA
jgi:hypothetical protein